MISDSVSRSYRCYVGKTREKNVPNPVIKPFRAALLLCLVLSLCACNRGAHPSGGFRLDETAVTAALEEVGLPGMISEEETIIHDQGGPTYVVRDPNQTYSGTDNPVLIAGVRGTSYEGERMLLATFDQEVASAQIDWADWEKQLAFAALLYSGLADSEEIYRAFAAKEVPSGQDRCQWDAQLTNAYCVIKWAHRSNKAYDAAQFEVRKHHASIWVNIYESQALYQKITTTQLRSD